MNEKDLVGCPYCRTTFISKEKFDEHDRTECDTIQYETAEDKSVRIAQEIAQESERIAQEIAQERERKDLEPLLNECESLVKIADIRGFLQQFKKTIDKLIDGYAAKASDSIRPRFDAVKATFDAAIAALGGSSGGGGKFHIKRRRRTSTKRKRKSSKRQRKSKTKTRRRRR